LEHARQADYDEPSSMALSRANHLLDSVAAAALDAAALRIGIGVDGAIAIHASNGVRSVSLEIDPVNGSLELVVSDERARRVISALENPTEAEVVQELERAA
jgi:hypothetical protein